MTFGGRLGIVWVSVTFGEHLLHWAGSERRRDDGSSGSGGSPEGGAARGADAPLGAAQQISIEEGLRAMTINAAWQLFEEDERGSLTPGKAADLVWLSENPLAVEPARLEEIRVRGTWIDGQRADLSRWRSGNLWLAARALWNTFLDKWFRWGSETRSPISRDSTRSRCPDAGITRGRRRRAARG